MGFTQEELSRPIVGIAQTWSEFNNRNNHFRTLAGAVKRGVWQEGGLPLEFPTISLGEVHTQPTTMLFRNLMAMDTEEMIRAQPMDSVVLLVGCDKTTPAALMGAASANVPAIMVSGGPMLNGRYDGHELGACTDARMSGTSYGTIVLHIAPESAIGEPLCLVRDGEWIALDVPSRALTLEVPEEDLARRRAAWQAPAPRFERGYRRPYQRHVLQSHHGCDFDFPRLPSGATPGS